MIFLNLLCYNAPTELFLAHMQVSVTGPVTVSINFIASQMVSFLSSWPRATYSLRSWAGKDILNLAELSPVCHSCPFATEILQSRYRQMMPAECPLTES